MIKKHFIFIFISTVVFMGCATTMAVRKDFNFTAYQKIGVMEFVSSGFYPESGASVSDEFIRQLIRKGRAVVSIRETSDSIDSIASRHNVDGIITGTVIRYIPDGRDRIFFKNDEGRIVSEIFFREAEIGVSAKFIDGKTGEVLWSDVVTHRGLDISHTINIVVNVLTRRLAREVR